MRALRAAGCTFEDGKKHIKVIHQGRQVGVISTSDRRSLQAATSQFKRQGVLPR